jgi:hypothetical protein
MAPFLSSMASHLGAQVVVSLPPSTQGDSASEILSSYGVGQQENVVAVDLDKIKTALPKKSGVHVLVSDTLFSDPSVSFAVAVGAVLDTCRAATSLKSILLLSRSFVGMNEQEDIAQGMLSSAVDYAALSLSQHSDGASVIHVIAGEQFGEADEQVLLSLMTRPDLSKSWNTATRLILPSALAAGVVQENPQQTKANIHREELKKAKIVLEQTMQAKNPDESYHTGYGSTVNVNSYVQPPKSSSSRSTFLALLLRLFGVAFPLLMTHRLLATMLAEEEENELLREQHAEALAARLGNSGQRSGWGESNGPDVTAGAKRKPRLNSEDCTHESDLERDLWFSYWMIFSLVCLIDDYFVPTFLQSAVFVPAMALLAWCGAMPGATGALTVNAFFVEPARELVSQVDSVVAAQIVNKMDSDEDTGGETEDELHDDRDKHEEDRDVSATAHEVPLSSNDQSCDEPSGGVDDDVDGVYASHPEDVQVKYAPVPPPAAPFEDDSAAVN